MMGCMNKSRNHSEFKMMEVILKEDLMIITSKSLISSVLDNHKDLVMVFKITIIMD